MDAPDSQVPKKSKKSTTATKSSSGDANSNHMYKNWTLNAPEKPLKPPRNSVHYHPYKYQKVPDPVPPPALPIPPATPHHHQQQQTTSFAFHTASRGTAAAPSPCYEIRHIPPVYEIIASMLTHNNVFRALMMPVNTDYADAVEIIKYARRQIENQARYDKTLSEGVDVARCTSEAMSRLNVCSSLLNSSKTRRVYLELANLNHTRNLPIPCPSNEVPVFALLGMAILTRVKYGFDWTSDGFPVKTRSGFRWVYSHALTTCTENLHENGESAAPISSSDHASGKNAIIHRLIRSMSPNISLPAADCTAIEQYLAQSEEWPSNDNGEMYLPYKNGLYDMSTLSFLTRASIIARFSADGSNGARVDPTRCPYSVNKYQRTAVSEEDVALLDQVKRECSDAVTIDAQDRVATIASCRAWMESWRTRSPGFAALLKRMPMYDGILTRHSMMRPAWNQSVLYGNLARGLYKDRSGSAGKRVLIFFGPSGCAKSTCIDVICEIVGQHRSVHVGSMRKNDFSDEFSLDKNIMVYSDACRDSRPTFDQLSNFADMNPRPVNIKFGKNVVKSPPGLVVATANNPHVMNISKSAMAEIDEMSISSRILPVIFNQPLDPTQRIPGARRMICEREGFYLTTMLLAHHRFMQSAMVVASEDELMPNHMKSLSDFVTDRILCKPTSDQQPTAQDANAAQKRVVDEKRMKFWNDALHSIGLT